MAERSYLVVSAVGPDRPGLVADLAAWVVEHSSNVEDSRMAVLGSSFSVMMLISGERHDLEAIRAGAAAVEAQTGLRLSIESTSAPRVEAGCRRIVVQIEAADREGLVHTIAAALRDLGGNIVNLETTLYPAPMSGAPLFKLKLFADVDAAVDASQLEQALAGIAETEWVDCRVVSR